MNDALNIKLYSYTIDCKSPKTLSTFYAKLLKWESNVFENGWSIAYPPGTKQGGYPFLLFQENNAYVEPVWPEEKNLQQQMAHLDFAVNDLDEAVLHAKACGAKLASDQFSSDWVVMFDPEGHPFCLCLMKDLMASNDFKLK